VAIAVALLSLPAVAFGVVVSTNVYFVEADVTETEDVYVAASSARVLGTIEGDLLVAAGDVTIAGTVTGDLVVASHGTVSISGDVGGSVRGVARDVRVSGTVTDDVAVAALTIEVSGRVDRDVLLLAASLDVTGAVTRDVLGRVQTATLDGRIGGDVDILVGSLTLGSELSVDGDVIYRSDSDASVSSGVDVAGSLSRLPTTGSFVVRAVLLFVNVIHLLSFAFAGLLLLWLFHPTMSAAVREVEERPLRAIGVGLIALVVAPVAVVVLVFSLIGIPVGLLLLLLLLLSLFFGPIPAVTALGNRLLGGRGALFGGFLLGVVLWRGALWLLPWVALFIYGLSVAAGLGGFVGAVYSRRRQEASGEPLAPVRAASGDDADEEALHEGWEPPLAPAAGSLDHHGDEDDESEGT
jgi:cytoskeletal protein CcmA (bactofilin family)